VVTIWLSLAAQQDVLLHSVCDSLGAASNILSEIRTGYSAYNIRKPILHT
jgi:hypothetical protein